MALKPGRASWRKQGRRPWRLHGPKTLRYLSSHMIETWGASAATSFESVQCCIPDIHAEDSTASVGRNASNRSQREWVRCRNGAPRRLCPEDLGVSSCRHVYTVRDAQSRTHSLSFPLPVFLSANLRVLTRGLRPQHFLGSALAPLSLYNGLVF